MDLKLLSRQVRHADPLVHVWQVFMHGLQLIPVSKNAPMHLQVLSLRIRTDVLQLMQLVEFVMQLTQGKEHEKHYKDVVF